MSRVDTAEKLIMELAGNAVRKDIPNRFTQTFGVNVGFQFHSWMFTFRSTDFCRLAVLVEIDTPIPNPKEDRSEREFIVEVRVAGEPLKAEVLGCVSYRFWLRGAVEEAARAGDPLFQARHLFESPVPGVVLISREKSNTVLDPIRTIRTMGQPIEAIVG
ncbi:MAG: hypothetical protein Q7S47_00100 [bacterium]|nr:hypothetical protein [bacterium]